VIPVSKLVPPNASAPKAQAPLRELGATSQRMRHASGSHVPHGMQVLPGSRFTPDGGAQPRSRAAPETPAPTGIPAPPPGTGTASRNAPGKCNCPVSVIGLPWIHDLSPGAEAARIHESGAAAFGWPYRRSGCRVNASRHLPAAAQGKVLPGGFHLLPGELTVRKASSYRLDN
jgi:hypothetical protein